MNKISRILIFLSLLLGIGAGFAPGQSFAQAVGEVTVGPSVVFRFYDDGVNDPFTRAETVTRRIESLLGTGLKADDVWMEKKGSIFVIYWGTEMITHVDEIQARLNKAKDAGELAKVWAGNLKSALAKNLFYLVPSSLAIATKSSATIRVMGVLKGPIKKEYEEGISIPISIDQEKGEITLRPAVSGQSKIVFSRDGINAALTVRVREPAAEIPDGLEAQVSGNPAPPEVLQFVAVNTAKMKIRPKPGARMEIAGTPRVLSSLDAGKTMVVSVPVRIEGKDYIPVRTDVPVSVKNTGEGFSEMKTLMVSNRPESTSTDGILYQETIASGSPARLLYYHRNASREGRTLWIELRNREREPVRVRVSGAMAGPSRWGVTVGHMAAIRFLEAFKNDVGYTIEIPAGSTFCLLEMDMPYDQIVCGYIHFQLSQGEKLDVLVKNVTGARKDAADMPLLQQPFDPFKIHPKGTFNPANIHSELTYVVGQEDEESSLDIGRAPWLIDPVTGEPNNGNYGVFYYFKIKLKNPTREKKRLGLYLVPESVLARGSFIVDGRLVETGIARNPGRLVFSVIDLLPGEEKEMNLVTTPEGGSYYPTRVVVQQVSESDLTQKVPDKPEEMLDLPAPDEDKD
jgi:hypothetical protein